MKSQKVKRPILLTRIVAVNWYGFNQVIEVEGNVVVTGEYGTGKSVLLDLMQRVLLGSATRYNRAATGDASSRKLKGYCLCDTNTGTDAGEDFARSQAVTFIALEFTWPDGIKRQTWGQRIEYASATSRPSILYFCWPDRLDLEAVCNEEGDFLDEGQFRAWLRREEADSWDREASYLDNLGVPSNLNFEWPLLRQTLPEALAFQVIRRFDEFIRGRLLPATPLQIDEVRRSLQVHRDYAEKLRNFETQLGYLTRIREHHAHAESADAEVRLLRIVERELELRHADETRDEVEALLISLRSQAEKEAHDLAEATEQLEAARAALASVQAEVDADKDVGRLDGLREKETTLRKKVASLKQRSGDALRELRERGSAWRRWLESGRPFAAALKRPLDPEGEMIAALETGDLAAGTSSMDGLAQHFHAVRTAGIIAQANLAGQATDLEAKVRVLKNDHDKLAKGETSGRFPLLEELHKRLPKTPGAFGPEQLCRLVELKDDAEPWRRAMELFLGNNRFAILLDPQRHRLAQRLLRDLELATNREPLVDPDEALKLDARPHPDSLAAKLDTKNAVARSYLDHLLGNVICVDSPDDFPGKARAITQDAILWRRPVTTKLGKAKRDDPDPFADYDPLLGEKGLRVLRERKERELIVRTEEWKKRKDESDRMSKWLESGDTLGLGSAKLTAPGDLAEQLRTAQGELNQTQQQLDILATPERDAIIGRLREKRGAVENLVVTKAGLEKSETIKSITTQEQKLADARQRAKDARAERETTHGKFGAGILNEHVAETAVRLIAEKRGWEDRLTRVRELRADASTLFTESRGERDKERALLRQEFGEFVRLAEDAEDNDEYDAEFRVLDEQQVPEYRRKADESRRAWEDRLKENVLGELRSLTDRAVTDIRQLNANLHEPIGHFRYRLSWEKRRDGDFDRLWTLLKSGFEPTDELTAAIRDPEVESAKALLMEALDKPEETALQLRLDYREFYKFDMECQDTALPSDSPWISLTRHAGKMSGGENQSPFFLAMLAAFLRVYRRAEPGRLGQRESLGLVPMDEAFSKLSGDGVESCMETARALGLQLVLAMPDKDAPPALRGADTILVVTIDKRQEAGRTVIENWAHPARASDALAELEGM